MTENKVTPHNLEAEEAVIGSLLIGGNDAFVLLNPILEPNEFYSERCAIIYNAILNIYKRNEKINENTVSNEVIYLKQVDTIGGLAYIPHLCSITPTYLDIDSYGMIVHRLSVYRKLINASEKIKDLGYNAEPDLDNSIAKANDILFKLNDSQLDNGFIHIREGLDKLFESQNDDSIGADRIKTGFTSLDELLGGFYKSDMVILAGRPGMGKSNIALNIARNAAVQSGASVAFFSIEMAMKLLLIRFEFTEFK
jgi:replicative DNA helicase